MMTGQDNGDATVQLYKMIRDETEDSKRYRGKVMSQTRKIEEL